MENNKLEQVKEWFVVFFFEFSIYISNSKASCGSERIIEININSSSRERRSIIGLEVFTENVVQNCTFTSGI